MFTDILHFVFVASLGEVPKEVVATPEAIRNRKARIKRRNLMQKNRRLANKLKLAQAARENHASSVESCIKLVSKFLEGPSLDFVATQIKMSVSSKFGRRWTAKDKATALSLYHSSPKTYRLLTKSRLFILPSLSTLKSAMREVEVYPGFSERLLQSFKIKVSGLPDKEKDCCLVFDEMAIKKGFKYDAKNDLVEGVEDLGVCLGRSSSPATHALVFMVRSLAGKWKQPLGYVLTSSTVTAEVLSMLVIKAVTAANSVGLRTRAMVCDQGPNQSRSYNDEKYAPHPLTFDYQTQLNFSLRSYLSYNTFSSSRPLEQTD